MKIAYVSCLPQTMSGGPKYSVPKQVDAQAQYDDVIWINLTKWGSSTSKVKCEQFESIEAIMNRIVGFQTELVVFEDLYYIQFYRISKLLRKKHIPYVIVPRGCLTRLAQKQKWYKKIPANVLLFLPFSRHALAIEFLSENERLNTSKLWYKESIIIPNGTTIPKKRACPSTKNSCFQGVFIGRINPYHKGLDVLFKACANAKGCLEERKCKIDFYGPFPPDVGNELKLDIEQKGLQQFISIHEEVHGDEKEKVIVSSDFFVLTSRFEGLPMGLLEALAYGLPALVTNETNIGELVAEAGAGYSSECHVEKIEKNLRLLLSLDEESLGKMSEAAVQFAKQYDWDEIARKAHYLYEMILKT